MGALAEVTILPTFQVVYDGGLPPVGNGAGRTLDTMNGGAVVFTNSGANNTGVFEVTKTPAGAQSGDGVSVVMGANATGRAHLVDWRSTAGGTAVRVQDSGLAGALIAGLTGIVVDLSSAQHGNQVVQGVTIVTPATTAVAATQQGLLNLQGRHSLMRDISVVVRNKGAANTDGLVRVEWDTTNFEGVAAASVLTADTNMLVLDGQTNVDASTNDVTFRGAWIRVPSTASAATRGIIVESLQTAGSTINATHAATAANAVYGYSYTRTITPTGNFTGGAVSITNTPGNAAFNEASPGLLSITHTSGALSTDTTTGIAVSLTPGAAGAVVTGLSITLGANSLGRGLLVTHGGTVAGAGSVALRLAGADESVALEMTDGDTVGVSAANEGRLVYNATDQWFKVSHNGGAYAFIVTAAGAGALSRQLAYNGGADVVVVAGTPLTISTAAAVDSNLLELANATIGSTATTGLTWTRATVPSNATTFTGGAISVVNAPTLTNSFTEGGTLVLIRHAPLTGAGTLTDTTTLESLLYNPTKNSATDTVTGQLITMTPNTAAPARGQTVVMSANTSAAGYAATFDWRGTAGTAAGNGIVNITNENLAANLTGPLTGLEIDLTDANHNNQALLGAKISVGATTRANTAGEGALVIDSNATAARVVDIDVANVSGNIALIRYGSATTFTGSVIGFEIDLATNVTGNGSTHIGQRIRLPAAVGSSSAGLDLLSLQTGGRHIVCRHAGTVLSAPLTGLVLDLSSNVTPGVNAITGIDIDVGPSSGAGTRPIDVASAQTGDESSGMFLVMNPGTPAWVYGITVRMNTNTSAAGAAAVFDWRGTAGTAVGNGIVNIEVGAATTFAGILTGIECDLATNVNAATAVALTNYTAKLSANMGSNASTGFAFTRTGTHTVNASTFTGSAISISNTPTGGAGGVNVTENGVLLNIAHTPVAGAGAITDTTTGLLVTMTPAAAATGVRGISVVMSANAQGAALSLSPAAVGVDFAGTNDGSAYIRGPTADDFRVNAGLRTTAGTGRALNFTAGAGVDPGAGGPVYINGGAAASTGGGGAQNGGAIDLQPGVGANGGLTGFVRVGPTTACAIEMKEMTAPAAGGADTGRLYLDVSGVKTRLMIIFQSGVAQQIAVEP